MCTNPLLVPRPPALSVRLNLQVRRPVDGDQLGLRPPAVPVERGQEQRGPEPRRRGRSPVHLLLDVREHAEEALVLTELQVQGEEQLKQQGIVG